MDDPMTEQLAKSLQETLAGWSFEAAYLGIRARFRCEYCGRPLLRSIEDYDTWQNDHIIPVSRGGGDDLGNKALACKPCNFFKRNFVPLGTGGGDARDALVASVRQRIQERRRRKVEELANVRRAVEQLAPGLLDPLPEP